MFLCVPQRLQSCDKRLERRVEPNEDVDRPGEVGVESKVLCVGCIRIVGVKFEVVLEEQLQNDVDRKDAFIEVNTVANILDFQCHYLPRCALVVRNSVPVCLFDKICPCGANVRYATVISCMVDKKTNVVVSCLIGVIVVELRFRQHLSQECLRNIESTNLIKSLDLAIEKLDYILSSPAT